MKLKAQNVVVVTALLALAVVGSASAAELVRPDDRAGLLAVGGVTAPDAVDRAVANGLPVAGSAPAGSVPDAVERAVANGLPVAGSAPAGAVPDAVDRALRNGPPPVAAGTVSTSDGFAWGDAALGAAGTVALFMLGAALLAVRHRWTVAHQ